MKKVGLAVLLTFLLVLSVAAVGWAEDPTGLYVVRSAANNLYKMTCNGTSCSAWTQIPGQFAQQPTLYWDENLSQYVLVGVSTANTMWRSTFSSTGAFNNDWVALPGNTPSPIAAAGSAEKVSGRALGNKGSVAASTLAVYPCTTRTTLRSVTITTPRYGRVILLANGIYAPGTAAKVVDICLSSTTTTCDSWSPFMGSNDLNYYAGEKRYALQHSYGGIAAGTYTYYLTGCADSGATGTVFWNEIEAIYVPEFY